MRTLDLDRLKPEGYEVTFRGEVYILEALTVERVIEAWPMIQRFQNIAPSETETADMTPETLDLVAETMSLLIPNFPVDALASMTTQQLTAIMGAVSSVIGATPGPEAAESPKPTAE